MSNFKAIRPFLPCFCFTLWKSSSDKNGAILNLPTTLGGRDKLGKEVFDYVCKSFGEDFVEDVTEIDGSEL